MLPAMTRRGLLALGSTLAIVGVARPARAGSYLNRAAVLLDASAAERTMVMPRADDEELLRVVHDVAEARAETARRMHVPKVIAGAHPHLLLALENCERGYAMGLEGQRGKLVEHLLNARSEDRTFRALVDKLGFQMPKT